MGRKLVKPEDRKRLTPAERTAQILDAAFAAAAEHGLSTVTLLSAGQACGVSDGLVSRYFGRSIGLRNAVVNMAIQKGNLDVIADGIELDVPAVRNASKTVLKQAKALLDTAAA